MSRTRAARPYTKCIYGTSVSASLARLCADAASTESTVETHRDDAKFTLKDRNDDNDDDDDDDDDMTTCGGQQSM